MAEKDVPVEGTAPDFQLPGSDDSVFSLSEAFRSGPVMLMFYPSDFGIVCSLQMREFRDMREDLDAKGIQVVGISRNSIRTHKQWKESMNIGFLLLADEDGAVCERYAGLQDHGLLKGLPLRAVFIVDRGGVIRYVWISRAEGQPPPFEEIKERIRSLDL